MGDVAIHIRIFEAEPTDDLVEKRSAAIKDLATRFAKKKTTSDLLQLANDLAAAAGAKGTLSTQLATDIEAAIKKQSTAFVQEGQALQLLVCGLCAALQYLETASTSTGVLLKTDLVAAGLRSALDLQTVRSEPKLEDLRSAVLREAHRVVTASSLGVRTRIAVPDLAPKAPEGGDWSKFVTEFSASALETIGALRSNAALDREELDLLWWMLNDWSTLLGKKRSSLPAPQLAVVAGIEAARLMRRLPNDAHGHLILAQLQTEELVTLGSLLDALRDVREKLLSASVDPIVTACPAVFPLLASLASGKSSAGINKSKRSLGEWGRRALFESTLVQLSRSLNPSI